MGVAERLAGLVVVVAVSCVRRRRDPPAKGSGDEDYVVPTRLGVAIDRRILMARRRAFLVVGVAAAVVALAPLRPPTRASPAPDRRSAPPRAAPVWARRGSE